MSAFRKPAMPATENKPARQQSLAKSDHERGDILWKLI